MPNNNGSFTRRALIGAGLTGIAAATVYTIESGCSHAGNESQQPIQPPPLTAGVAFEDVTKSCGVDFKHVNGAFGQKWLPETMGSGLAWIDYNNDGYQDLFLVNSRQWTAAERMQGHQPPDTVDEPVVTCKLYHNDGTGHFTDVTQTAGLAVPMYGTGVCVGDFNNDGYPDLFVTSLNRCYLFRNNGNGTFTDVTDLAGVRGGGWSTSAAFVDYDLDGHLDLFVCHYVNWSPAKNRPAYANGHPTYTTPQKYVGLPPKLYHNNGNGTFTDVSAAMGVLNSAGSKVNGKSLGVALLDYDNDGWPDIVVANDTEPNYLYHNMSGARFKEVGQEVGIAYADRGAARGAMGIDTCDYDRSGFESIAIGNFSEQQIALYHNDGGKSFTDVASQDGLGPPSLHSLSFGLFFFDMDNDGHVDLFVANGHVDDDVEETQKLVTYAERPLIYRNMDGGNFVDVSDGAGPDITRKLVARGAAFADYDLDGFPDIAISTNNGPAYIYKNRGCENRAIRLELIGVKSNKSAIGALIEIKDGPRTQRFRVRSGSSYCSQSELPVTIGVGALTTVESITITWPHKSVKQTILPNVASGYSYRIEEGKGIVKSWQFIAVSATP